MPYSAIDDWMSHFKISVPLFPFPLNLLSRTSLWLGLTLTMCLQSAMGTMGSWYWLGPVGATVRQEIITHFVSEPTQKILIGAIP